MIVKINNLHKSYKQNLKETKVLKGLDIKIPEGKIYGFLWPNGSGKTTTLKCILWFLDYQKGDIKIFDKDLNKNPQLHKKIWYAPENTYFYDFLNGMEFLDFMGQLTWQDSQTNKKKGESLLKKVDLLDAKNQKISSYSKGMKQRLGLAGSLINDPKLIFWDEPMSWLDPIGRKKVKELMNELKEQNKTIIFNTHVLSDVENIADEFGILYDGQILYKGQPQKLDTNLEDFFIEKINE